MKLVISTSSGVVKIGISKDLHAMLNTIYYLDIKREPIVRLTQLFFDALHLYEKTKDADLWYFLYYSELVNRLMKAMSRTNQIDGELLQRALNTDKKLAEDYMYFNRVYKKLSEPPKIWYDRKFREAKRNRK